MGLLNETFGLNGTAQGYFGGEVWLVGILLILIFVLYLFAKGVNTIGLAIITFSGVLLITIDNLFIIPSKLTMTVIILILLFVSHIAASQLSK